MRILNIHIHGLPDLLLGLIALLSPWLMGYTGQGIATLLPVIIGGILVLLAISTDFEVGLIKILPVTVYLKAAVLLAILLAVSPWLLGFAGAVFWPHLLMGYFIGGFCLISLQSSAVKIRQNRIPAM